MSFAQQAYEQIAEDMPRFPHCDPRILHTPGICKACDANEFRILHEWRIELNIRYTDELGRHEPLLPWEDRNRLSAERWWGNVAYNA